MSDVNRAARAYEAGSANRSLREQEADVFIRATGALRNALAAGAVEQVRAMADNRRLWSAVIDLVRDPDNALPEPLRAAIVSVGIAVQREMDRSQPDFGFRISSTRISRPVCPAAQTLPAHGFRGVGERCAKARAGVFTDPVRTGLTLGHVLFAAAHETSIGRRQH